MVSGRLLIRIHPLVVSGLTCALVVGLVLTLDSHTRVDHFLHLRPPYNVGEVLHTVLNIIDLVFNMIDSAILNHLIFIHLLHQRVKMIVYVLQRKSVVFQTLLQVALNHLKGIKQLLGLLNVRNVDVEMGMRLSHIISPLILIIYACYAANLFRLGVQRRMGEALNIQLQFF